MRFLLINKNAAVSKLVSASLERIGHEVTEIDDMSRMSLDTFILAIVDNESYKSEYTDDLLSITLSPSLLYLKADDAPPPEGIKFSFKKPFLPTDFIAYIVKILQNTPELKRFITPEVEQFKNTVLKDSPELLDEQPIPPPFEERTTEEFDKDTKAPIFEMNESAPSADTFDKGDIFANLSNDLAQIYGGNADKLRAQTDAFEGTQSVFDPQNAVQESAPALDPNAPIDISFAPEPIKADESDMFSLNSDDFIFALKGEENAETSATANDLNTQAAAEKPTTISPIEPEAQTAAPAPTEELTQSSDEAQEKVDFDFDLGDKIDEQKEAKKSDVIEQMSEPDNSSADNADNTDEEKPRVDFGFGDLAREFDDLIQDKKSEPQTPSEEKAEIQPVKSQAQNTDNLEALSEKEMKTALQESGMLPPPNQIDIVKTEIENVVEQSVKGALQSQILRDVLKGLKMSITITFEDK